MTKRVDLHIEQEVIRLYTTMTDNGWMGRKEISKRLGISPFTVENILIRNNVKIRTSQEAYAFGKRSKPIKNIPIGKAPLCKCNCGNFTEWNQRKNKWNVYYKDHYRAECVKNIGERKSRPRLYKVFDWLKSEYESGRTLRDIAKQFGVSPGTIGENASKFGITIRPHGEELKRLGTSKGNKNPAWKGGTTPDRQIMQKTDEWKNVVQFIYKRDGYKCRRCGHGHNAGRKFHAHHIKSFSTYPDLRLVASNLVTLCDVCHQWVHSNKNVNQDFISD